MPKTPPLESPPSDGTSAVRTGIAPENWMETSDSDLTIFVVEDDLDVRESMTGVLEELPCEVRSYPTAEQFLLSYIQHMELYGQPAPGCVVLDVRMPGMSGMELHLEIVRRKLPVSVIVHTAHGSVPISVEAMRRGAIDVLEKPSSPSELRERVRQGLDAAKVIWEARERNEIVNARVSVLTARETEVYELLLRGLETKQIGQELGISPSTVEKHRLKVFDKMGVDTVPRLIRFVLDNVSTG